MSNSRPTQNPRVTSIGVSVLGIKSKPKPAGWTVSTLYGNGYVTFGSRETRIREALEDRKKSVRERLGIRGHSAE